MKNLGTSLSKSLTERDSTYEICSSLLSLLGIFKKVGSQAQMPPGAQRDAILLPWTLRIPCRSLTYDTARNKRYAMALWNKTLEGTPSLLQWSPTCASCKLCRFFVGDFGLQFILWDQFSDNGPHPPVICLSAWGTSMLKKRQGLCFGSLFQVPVELPGFLWRDESRKKTLHGSMVQIKTWPNTALMQTHTTHPAPRAERLSERPLKWTSDVPDTHHCCRKTIIDYNHM